MGFFFNILYYLSLSLFFKRIIIFIKILIFFSRENKRQAKTELDWKMQLMLKIDAVIHSQNLRLLDAFNVYI